MIMIHDHLQILLGSLTGSCLLLATNRHFNAPPLLRLLINISSTLLASFIENEKIVENLRISQTWPARPPLRLDCCNTRSCYSRLASCSTVQKELCLSHLRSSMFQLLGAGFGL